ncbi:hypothetical protein EV702DRAFT_1050675 [Suillus placidus]|uniref:Uncharacterized protein n=1 Tax=Suillus placidus TaxID=48579 RepID=A0A9P6ZIE6_9AGAM|nr:hypothetical protein EV702DRAFT_1050675 [Suillus placidus]
MSSGRSALAFKETSSGQAVPGIQGCIQTSLKGGEDNISITNNIYVMTAKMHLPIPGAVQISDDIMCIHQVDGYDPLCWQAILMKLEIPEDRVRPLLHVMACATNDCQLESILGMPLLEPSTKKQMKALKRVNESSSLSSLQTTRPSSSMPIQGLLSQKKELIIMKSSKPISRKIESHAQIPRLLVTMSMQPLLLWITNIEDLSEPKVFFTQKAEKFAKDILNVEPHHLGLKLKSFIINIPLLINVL